MNKVVRNKLIELAQKREMITYQELSDTCNLNLIMHKSEFDSAEIGRILGEISMFEYQNDRPLLSSLVVTKDRYQGDGYYKLCEELGLGSWKKLKNDISFEMQQINGCYDFWCVDLNYTRYK